MPDHQQFRPTRNKDATGEPYTEHVETSHQEAFRSCPECRTLGDYCPAHFTFTNGYREGQRTERARIVAWLRECEEASDFQMQARAFHNAADMIEDGSYRV